MRRLLALFAVAFAWVAGTGVASAARLDIRVDLSSQTMRVTTPTGEVHRWAISSGKEGFRTPGGRYRPQVLKTYHYSNKYQGAMPHSIFFRGGYAIHGTSEVRRLGRPASHGCIRLAPAHAAKLFHLVRTHGMGRTSIAIGGATPGPIYAGKAGKKKQAIQVTPKKKKYAAATPKKGKGDGGKGKKVFAVDSGPPIDAGGFGGHQTGGHPMDGGGGKFPQLLR